jgi:hypothetical protein
MEKKENSLQDWGALITRNLQSPTELSKISTALSGHYAYKTGLYVAEKIKWAKWYTEHKKDPNGGKNSDKYLEAMYLITPEGQQFYLLKKELRAYEKMMDAVRSSIFVANQEAKNLNQ